MRSLRSALLVAFLAPLVLAGCAGGTPRPQLVPVSGKVTYKGQPVAGAVVTFMSPASPRTATGQTNDAGEFKLSTYSTDDGVIAGEHTVTITKVEAPAQAQPMDPRGYAGAMASGQGSKGMPVTDPVKQTLPTKYADVSTSGLTRQVLAGDVNHFEFDLTD